MKKLLLAALFMTIPSAAFADHAFDPSSPWQGAHWDGDGSWARVIELRDVLPGFHQALDEVADTWSNNVGSIAFDRVVNESGGCDWVDGVIKVCNKSETLDPCGTEAIACAVIDRNREHHFVGAVIVFKTSFLRAVDRPLFEQVLCGEIGHALGLDHGDDFPSCMTHSAENPNDHEKEVVRDLHAHYH